MGEGKGPGIAPVIIWDVGCEHRARPLPERALLGVDRTFLTWEAQHVRLTAYMAEHGD